MCFIFELEGIVFMEQTYLLQEGATLMLVGMVIVFAFLVLLVWVMSLSRFFERFSYLLPDSVPTKAAKPSAKPAADEVARIAVAIAAASAR